MDHIIWLKLKKFKNIVTQNYTKKEVENRPDFLVPVKSVTAKNIVAKTGTCPFCHFSTSNFVTPNVASNVAYRNLG